ncbi:SOSS complex subunit C-like [Hydractinia symbiolongicarpus]|uniref:SOSS complex subunit C-like n=1 Tax=Hydractinia symbiolongicarpus TaxID=13093 RepID=UPI00254B1719|nr:SOSS complex subunit C-like [Hydractinia symbiolongicarpus]
MSYHVGHSDLRNRQSILQDLHQQKQQLLQQSSGNSTSTSNSSHISSRPIKHDPRVHSDGMHQVPMTRRTALEYASNHSSGYFIAQDSQHGNPILPVIPRIEDKD